MNNLELKNWCQNYTYSENSNSRETLLMGIVNLTPDSFYDKGQHFSLEKAKAHAEKLIEEGVDLIDIGGESSRPGAKAVSLAEEEDRVLPLIEYLRKHSQIAISIDTTKPELMRRAVNAGAGMINDIKALSTPGALDAAVDLKVPVCLMHMQGEPETMQHSPKYENVIQAISEFFKETIDNCLLAGMDQNLIILDPGFGFGKTAEHNLRIIKQFSLFKIHNRPLLLGVSRKNTIGLLLDKPVEERLIGSLTLSSLAILSGASIIRTHDVDATKQVVSLLKAYDAVEIN